MTVEFGVVFGVFVVGMLGLIVFVVRFGVREQRRANRAAGRVRPEPGDEADLN